MANWELLLRGAIPREIDFSLLVKELAGTNAIFLHDYHSESTPHSGNQKKVIEEIIKIPEVFLGLEYNCEDYIASYHKPLVELSRNAGKEPILLAPQNENSGFWASLKEYEAHILNKIKENIGEGKRMAVVIGENHMRPGEKHLAGIPFLLNGGTTAAIIYQDLLNSHDGGIFKLEKRIPGKIIYNINGKIS